MTSVPPSRSARAERLLAAARRGTEPSAEDKARVRGRLHRRVLAAPLLLGLSAKTAHAVTAGAQLTTAKVLLFLGICGGVAVVGSVALRSHVFAAHPAASVAVAAPSASVKAPAPVAVLPAPIATETPAVTASAPAAPAPAAAAPSAPQKRSAPIPSASALSAQDMQLEIAGLRQAQQLLHAGDAAGAVSALDRLAREVPSGALVEERDATRVLALCAEGRVRDAAVDSFLARYPNSVHASRVRSACSRGSFE